MTEVEKPQAHESTNLLDGLFDEQADLPKPIRSRQSLFLYGWTHCGSIRHARLAGVRFSLTGMRISPSESGVDTDGVWYIPKSCARKWNEQHCLRI